GCMSVKVESVGHLRLSAELWMVDVSVGFTTRLYVPAMVVPSYRVEPQMLQVGVLDADRPQAHAEVLCWSSTRPLFKLDVDTGGDPLITCSPPAPIKFSETYELSKQHQSHVFSGYRLQVTVRERSGDKQLELGP